MRKKIARLVRRAASYIITDIGGGLLARLLSRKLRRQLATTVTDEFLELLLHGMDLAFDLSKGYRKNIIGFKGRYVFRTAGGEVAASAIFDNTRMEVLHVAVDDPDVEVIFKDARAIWTYLLSKDQDILNSLLNNEVEVNGNLNLIYRFGYLAKDLTFRLGVA